MTPHHYLTDPPAVARRCVPEPHDEAPAFTRRNALAWMRARVSDGLYLDCGEVNMTALAEGCAVMFEQDGEGGPLDDGDHWIWEEALRVHDEHDRSCRT